MMSNENNPIDFGAFTAKTPTPDPEPIKESLNDEGRAPAATDWPSRQPVEAPDVPQKVEEDQVSIKGPKYIIDAFKASAKLGRARVPYFDRLETLMALEDRLKAAGRSERSDPLDTLEELIKNADRK